MTWLKGLGIVVAMLAAFTVGIWTAILVPDGPWPFQAEPTPVLASTPTPTPTPEPVPTSRPPYTGPALAYGDYVAVSVKRCLKKLDFTVDANSERRIGDAITELARMDDSIPGGVLLHLGANGGASAAELDQVMKILGPDRLVVWTTIQIPDDPERYTFEQSTNAAIVGLAETYPNVRIFSWNTLSMTNPDWLNADGSMTKAGCKAFADFADRILRG